MLNLHTSYAVEKAYNDMKESVSRLASPEGFEGVTVQPMISLKGYEIILGTWAKWDGLGWGGNPGNPSNFHVEGTFRKFRRIMSFQSLGILYLLDY